MYSARVLADSVTAIGSLGQEKDPDRDPRLDPHRLITVVATFPRFILVEINTHRVLSRNSASSRAIPPEKLIEQVKENPFIPETFNQRVKGMGVGEALDSADYEECVGAWLEARDSAVRQAERLNEIGIDKSRINRLLEPFMWHTAIISGTDWDNFFALRAPVGDRVDVDFPAQLEFQKIAIEMRRVMRASTPRVLEPGEWHLPLVSEHEEDLPEEIRAKHGDLVLPMLSAGRAARVSYDTHENFEPIEKSIGRAESLADAGHMSPFEHQARALDPATENPLNFLSNFAGSWVQMRKLIPHEENRVGELEGRPHWAMA